MRPSPRADAKRSDDRPRAMRCRTPVLAPFYGRLCRTGEPAEHAIVPGIRKLVTSLDAIARDRQASAPHA